MCPARRYASRQILWFLLWLIVFSAPVSALIVHLGSQPPMTSRMIMWCPGLAALAACLTCRIPVASLGWAWPAGRFLGYAYIFPVVYAVPVYLAVWLVVPSAFTWQAFASPFVGTYHLQGTGSGFALWFGVPTTMIWVVMGTVAWTLGEELGWRGFLVPRVAERMGLLGTGLCTGLLWAVWHYPSLLGSTYNAHTSPVYEMACFTTMVVGLGVIMAWIRLASGSVWPCVLLHAVHNTLVQGVLDAATATNGRAPWLTGEFGAGLALTVALTAAGLVVRQSRIDRVRSRIYASV
ncbi:CPBP family intramembrane glutamic endopeptidase [Luteibacter yeojuensis]|uniref:CAAX prenyl protease 2/Lysostaphin resistance protein A-like domain-containing protein n=1 Tax=Luteibacter yeojuensis TaxID=345309 RepID=A0A0F3KJG1_9GAMM|nr:CPBP family intramembrane glutamic endopeptidase [Luteibacter yeojuensis]KJV31296.1 hypothetical protein VI08_13650 [Luteibacter yeojuensis]